MRTHTFMNRAELMKERTKTTREREVTRNRSIGERSTRRLLSSDLLALLLLLLRRLLIGGLAAPTLLVLLLVVALALLLRLVFLFLLLLLLLGGAGGDDVGHLGVDLDVAQDGVHGSLLWDMLACLILENCERGVNVP